MKQKKVRTQMSRLIDADALGLTDMEIIMCNGNYKEALKMLLYKIDHAPTIKPERKTGHWIDDGIDGYGALMIEYRNIKCDQCGWSSSLVIPRNFCPNCGSYNRGDDKCQ